MSNQIQFQSFNFQSSAVRVVTDPNQEFWFCGTDVCSILGYTNAPKALKDHCKEKGITKRYTLTEKGNQELIFINEPNLYRLIIKSRKPEAEPFEAWVFEEVLPQIRKTGQYAISPEKTLPVAEPTYTRELTERQWLRFASLWFALYNNLELLGRVYKPLEALGSRYGVEAYTHWSEYQTTLGALQRLLVPMLAEFEADPMQDGHFHKALKTLREYKPHGLGAVVIV